MLSYAISDNLRTSSVASFMAKKSLQECSHFEHCRQRTRFMSFRFFITLFEVSNHFSFASIVLSKQEMIEDRDDFVRSINFSLMGINITNKK
jgi:hypothetical protein